MLNEYLFAQNILEFYLGHLLARTRPTDMYFGGRGDFTTALI